MSYKTPCVLRIVILKPVASTSVASTENPNLSVLRLAPDSMPAIATETVGLVPNGRANVMGGDVQIVGPPRGGFSVQSGGFCLPAQFKARGTISGGAGSVVIASVNTCA